MLLYLAMSGLLVDGLTVPEVLAPFPTDELIADMVDRIVRAGGRRKTTRATAT